jgi:hypothetical protein
MTVFGGYWIAVRKHRITERETLDARTLALSKEASREYAKLEDMNHPEVIHNLPVVRIVQVYMSINE